MPFRQENLWPGNMKKPPRHCSDQGAGLYQDQVSLLAHDLIGYTVHQHDDLFTQRQVRAQFWLF